MLNSQLYNLTASTSLPLVIAGVGAFVVIIYFFYSIFSIKRIKKRNEKIMKTRTIIGLGIILTVKSEYPQSSSILPKKNRTQAINSTVIFSRYKFHFKALIRKFYIIGVILSLNVSTILRITFNYIIYVFFG